MKHGDRELRAGSVLAACCALLVLGCSDGGAGDPAPGPAQAGSAPPSTSGAVSSAGSGAGSGPITPTTPPAVPAAGSGSASGGASGSSAGGAGAGAGASGAAASGAGTSMQPDAGAADAASEPAPQVTCPASAKPPGDHNGSIEHGGHMRPYLLHLPRNYTGRDAVPLIVDFHGYGQPTSSQLRASGFADLSEEHGFAVVYPAGVGGSWHVNGCCGQAAQEKLDEIAAVRALLERIASEVCVDPKRIYASGISQGGGMAHHVGCLAADVFAAVAPVSSDLRTDPCTPARPISELSFRGTADTLSAYEGGPVGPPGGQYQSIGAKATLERWRTINGCTGMPEISEQFCETYKNCKAGTEVTLCSIPNGAHALYTNPPRFDLAKYAWAMFERQHLP